jgi:hypothetical protein
VTRACMHRGDFEHYHKTILKRDPKTLQPYRSAETCRQWPLVSAYSPAVYAQFATNCRVVRLSKHCKSIQKSIE